MSEATFPKRREFLGRVAAGAVALGLSGSIPRAFAGEVQLNSDLTPSDKWLTAVTGKHRQIFEAARDRLKPGVAFGEIAKTIDHVAEKEKCEVRLTMHGRKVCLARKPLCPQCAVARYCDSRELFTSAH